MPRLLFLTLVLLLPSSTSAQSVRDSVEMSLDMYTFYSDYVIGNTPRTACGAGIHATWPNVLQDLLGRPDRTYGYRDYSLVATDGMYVPRGYGQVSEDHLPAGTLGHNPQIGGSVDGPRPVDCSGPINAVQYRLAGGTGPLNARPFRITRWYATFSVPDGTAIALFEWGPGDGLAIDFDASFESEQSREIDITAPNNKRPVVSYQWDFGDGETGSGARPTHTYDEAGEYTVRLLVTDDDGDEATREELVTVHAAHLTVDILEATEEAVKGDTISVRARVTNSGTETVFGVSARREFTYVPRLPSELEHPSAQIWAGAVKALELEDGEDNPVTRGSLAPGESVEITRKYVLISHPLYRIFGETDFEIENRYLDWTGLFRVQGETPEVDSVEVRQPCRKKGAECATTLLTAPQADIDIRTSTVLAAVQVERSNVQSGLIVGPSPRVPISNGSPTRFADHRFMLDGDNRCRSGCIDFEITATDPDTGDPLPGVNLDISHPAITGPSVVTPDQGGGFLCDLKQNNCGQSITLTTDGFGRAEGYLAVPGVIRDTNVDLKVEVSGTQAATHNGLVGQKNHTITITPNVLYDTPIPINEQQAEDLGAATAIRVGFVRTDLPNKLCAGVKNAVDTASKRSFKFKEVIPTEFFSWVCENVSSLTYGELLDLGKEAPKIVGMAWFFDSTQLPDLGMATTKFKSEKYFFDVTSQIVDEINTALEGRLESDATIQPGAAPFSLHEVSYLWVDPAQGYPVKKSVLYFRMWDHTALIENDYDAGLWLVERYDRGIMPSLASSVSSNDTSVSTAPTSSETRLGGTRPLFTAADSVAVADSLVANAILVLSPDSEEHAETVRVLSVSGDPASGQTAELASPLLYDHPEGTPIHVLGTGEASALAPYLVAPVDTVSIGDRVRLTWATPQPLSEVDLEIARDAAFTDVFATQTISGTELATGSHDVVMADAGISREASYFWRARGRDRTGETAWTSPMEFFISSVVTSTDPAASAPERLSLNVYPNPAATRATLVFELPDAQSVQVSVFDALGRRIAAPVDEHRAAGRHELAIQVSELPVGVYVARVATETGSTSQRFTVVR